MGIDKDYSIEDIRAANVEKLYDILASCQSPGYYQMAVEELQRRFLTEIASQVQNLTNSTQRVETVTTALQGAVGDVDVSIRRLTGSSERLEQLTKWIIWLTVALLLLTVGQVMLIVKDQLRPQPVSVERSIKPGHQEAPGSEKPPEPPK